MVGIHPLTAISLLLLLKTTTLRLESKNAENLVHVPGQSLSAAFLVLMQVSALNHLIQ